MDYDECPLDVLNRWDVTRGVMVLVLQPPPLNFQPKKQRRKRPTDSQRPLGQMQKTSPIRLPEATRSPTSAEHQPTTISIADGIQASRSPQLLEVIPPGLKAIVHRVWPSVTEVGFVPTTSHSFTQYIKLPQNQGLLPRHCVLANMEGIVTITPHETARVVVDGEMIRETYMLENAASVVLGQDTTLIFVDEQNPDMSDFQGISPDQLKKKISEAGVAIAQANQQQSNIPIKAINQLRPGTAPKRPEDNDSPQIQQYTEEPGLHRFRQSNPPPPAVQKSTGYSHISNAGTPQVAIAAGAQSAMQPARRSSRNNYKSLLPAQIDYTIRLEDTLLTGIFQAAEEKPLQFRLAPSYALYLCVRYHYTSSYTTPLIRRITQKLQRHIEMNNGDPGFLAFWMANSSELLNFLRQDRHLAKETEDTQEELAQTVQLAFKYLVHALEENLLHQMPAFLSASNDDLPGEDGNSIDAIPMPFSPQPTMYDIIQMLNNAMSLLRRCRVNAALTIQLFSQLFHFINMFLFNEVVTRPELKLCCHHWGMRIRLRLSRVEAWAEKQGLELAAECHLARVTQAMHLLQTPKHNLNDVAEISSTCFKLNSFQLRALLEQYEPEDPREPPIPQELIERVVIMAEENADQLTREDGREVMLEEDPDLQLPFLLPEDGYTSDVLRGVPAGLHDFIEPLQANGLCDFSASPETTGLWTVYFMPQEDELQPNFVQSDHSQSSSLDPRHPQQENFILCKKGGGLGLSIVAARGSGQAEFGIYIKSVVQGGAAYEDGRLASGDLLVAVDDQSLQGLTQDRAADVMRQTGENVKVNLSLSIISLLILHLVNDCKTRGSDLRT